MCNAEEIDKRVEGTEMAAMIDRGAANQRSGVLGSLNMVADAFKLLPKESETTAAMEHGRVGEGAQGMGVPHVEADDAREDAPADEPVAGLACVAADERGIERSARRGSCSTSWPACSVLPQLTTAVTENRKSNNPMVLGFQGKAQVEALYGHVAEAMLSQPATKIFLKTSEPHASEWISKAIGEIEIERFRESRTRGQFPRNSENEQRDITREPLVMASEVAGLIRCMAI